MARIILFTALFFSIFCFGCSADITTVEVVRSPVITFNYNTTFAWQSNSYSFAPVAQTVVYPQDSSLPGQLYNRYILRATGQDNAGNKLQLTITFDAVNADELIGIYTPAYTTLRGLAEVQLFNLSNNNLSAYQLCNSSLQSAVFQIKKQKADERLITGTFQMTVCNTRDTTEQINIINGVLNDITY